jgi:hypothetical protein
MSEINLKYINGKFDDESIQKILEIEKANSNFKKKLMEISKSFYGIGVNCTNMKIDYDTILDNIKGNTLNIHIVNDPPIEEKSIEYNWFIDK